MAPKRKAAAKGKAGAKKAKKDDQVDAVKDVITKLKAADKGKQSHKVDTNVYNADSFTVHEDYDCMLNQTNIGHNNNKFYVIQILVSSNGDYHTWNRWGRVGESGASKLSPQPGLDEAVKDFEKKFKDKSKNNWADRDKFKPVPGKYTLIDMADDDDDDEVDAGLVSMPVSPGTKCMPCKLDTPTQTLMKLIFDNDMFRDAMVNFKIDVRKMPLGKLSKSQIAKGFECLTQIGDVISKKKSGNLMELSSKFYTVIPHDFGRNVPPKIADADTLQNKLDILTVLTDIEIAQSLQKVDKKPAKSASEPNPLDVKYDLLNCGLTLVKPDSNIHKVIEKYTKMTGYSNAPKILNIWEVDRDTEGNRFKAHKTLSNRKLLWHGTNVAVVAAILKSGLRIMPHSGGRVGKGIYFASENSKSACYVSPANSGVGIMFLNEVALGKEYTVTKGDGSLTKAPNGYDSIVARGCTEPDSKADVKVKLEANDVTVPQGKPINTSYHSKSGFSQSEYLVYKESQCRMRYLLMMKFC